MSDTTLTLTAPSQTDRLFPTLTDAQVARIAARGTRRQTAAGELLVEAGAHAVPFFVVVTGELQVSDAAGAQIVRHRAGQFSGEVSMITGRPAVARTHVAKAGEVIELNRQQLLTLVQTDAELSAILMRAFILRRLELIARHVSDVVVLPVVTTCETTLLVAGSNVAVPA